MSVIVKYKNVLRELIRLRFQKLMLFRIGVIGPFFVDGSMFGIQLLVFSAIYANVDAIGSWGRGEMILYIGSFSMLNAISMMVCFFGLVSIPGKIRSGDLDLYLTKPVSPLFRLSLENMSPGSGLLVVMSALIIAYGVRVSDVGLCPGRVLAYLFWMMLMQILYYLLEVLIRTMTFYVLGNSRIEQIEEASIEMCMQLPGIALYGVYKIIFYYLLPYGMMATLPVQSMIGELTWQMALQGIFVVAGFGLLTGILWKRGLKRYNSASS